LLHTAWGFDPPATNVLPLSYPPLGSEERKGKKEETKKETKEKKRKRKERRKKRKKKRGKKRNFCLPTNRKVT